MKKRLLQCLLIALPIFPFAQDTTKTIIRAGKLFNSEAGTFMSDMAILITGRVIDTVQPFKEISNNQLTTYKLTDLSRYTVLPGLIDAHTHLLNKETLIPENKYEGLDMLKTVTMQGDAYRAIYGAVRAKAYLEAGITAVQDLGNSGQFADIALRNAISEGLVPGPRMRCAGMGLSSEGGQMPKLIYKHRDLVQDEYRIVKGPEDAVQAVRENITQGADVIKIYSNNTPNVTALSIEEMRAIVKEAHRYNVRVTAHATDNRAVYNAVVSGVDGIEHGYEIKDTTLQLMAKKGVVLVPTYLDTMIYRVFGQVGYANVPNIDSLSMLTWKELAAQLNRAVKAGVTIVAGSDDYIDFKLPYAVVSKRTLLGYNEAGMKITEVLKAATINAARQLNWSSWIGIVKKGFAADLIAVDADVDNNIAAIMNVHFVMKNGKVYVNK